MDTTAAGDGSAAWEGAASQVAVIEHNMTVDDLVKVFATRRILSAPLVVREDAGGVLEDPLDAEGGAAYAREQSLLQPAYRMLGWISIGDVVRALVQDEQAERAKLSETSGGTNEQPHRFVLDRMAMLARLGHAFIACKAITLGTTTDGDVAYAGYTASMGMVDLVKNGLLRRPPTAPCHRIGVFAPNGEVQAIISQSDVVRYLAGGSDRVGANAHRSLEQLGQCGAAANNRAPPCARDDQRGQNARP